MPTKPKNIARFMPEPGISARTMPTFDLIVSNNKSMSPLERLGQYFVNRYIKQSWAELYYAEDAELITGMIKQWLKDNQYETDMPPKIRNLP